LLFHFSCGLDVSPLSEVVCQTRPSSRDRPTTPAFLLIVLFHTNPADPIIRVNLQIAVIIVPPVSPSYVLSIACITHARNMLFNVFPLPLFRVFLPLISSGLCPTSQFFARKLDTSSHPVYVN